MERIMVTIPTDLLRDVDSTAKRLNLNRSQLVRQALAELLQQLKQQEFELFLAEGYREMAKENTAIVTESLPIQSAAFDIGRTVKMVDIANKKTANSLYH